MPEFLKVVGYRELITAINDMPKEIQKDVRDALRTSGDRVRLDSAARISSKSLRTATGYRTYVRTRDVSVEQSLNKTTGLRPKWRGEQYREALLPALTENESNTVRDFEKAVDEINDFFALRSRWIAKGFIPA